MNSEEIGREITKWFVKEHSEFVNQNSLKSWADLLGIKLQKNGDLDEDGLFHLFVLASLWNNHPTLRTNRGIEAFQATKDKYTLENFRQAQNDIALNRELRMLAAQEIGNSAIFNLLEYIANGTANRGSVWDEIKRILYASGAGIVDNDISRLMQLHSLFDGSSKKYDGDVYLKVKLFLVFRELRIQFKTIGQFQFHPAICCVSDSHVREALQDLGLAQNIGTDLKSLINVSKLVAQVFCTEAYELYDLPLFFAHKEKIIENIVEHRTKMSHSTEHAGNCPVCGATLVWRVAQKTGERYRGCTNFKGGCRWNDRSY